MTMKTRFAPSPTGYLHLGNVRTALFCALLAKAQNGIFLLRVEDTDASRSMQEFADQLQEDLHWLGLPWQEGPTVGGPNGPYFQSQRQTIYQEYYQRLLEINQLYPCFCTEQQLAIARKVQQVAGQPPRYSGTCRALTAEQVAQKQAQGLTSVLRFRVPDNQTIEFVDFVRGAQRFATNEIGDFIVRRTDGTAPFFFCNAIDDALMGVTHVLRGEDHLTNTPRQLLILQTLKLSLPQYGHMAMIVGPDNTPLSKRHGSRSIKELRAEGYLAAAVVNYLARLGHYYPSNEFMNLTQLAKGFTTESLGKAAARFDAAQLLYWQKQAVQQLTADQYWQWLGADVQALVPADKREIFIAATQPNVVFPAEALRWAQIFFAELAYSPEGLAILQQTEPAFFATAIAAVTEHGLDFKAISQQITEKIGAKGKGLFQPLRAALTGQLDGPEMAKILECLGVEKIQQRLEAASKKT